MPMDTAVTHRMGGTFARDALYLDFDGVLHPHPVVRSPKRGLHLPQHPGRSLFESAPLLIQALLPYPRLRIVLSTSWVAVLGYRRARNYLPPELAARCVGATFHSRHHQAERELSFRDARFAPTRASQILADVARRKPDRWLAIDDDDDGWPRSMAASLVVSNADEGLRSPMVLEELRCRLERFR
jgi:hypothetical protein